MYRNSNLEKVSGIILTGGRSSRFGKDKGFLKINEKYFIEIAIELMSEICDEIFISTNSNKYEGFGCITVEDQVSGAGPIAGVYSCLKRSSNNHNIIIPVDTPFIIKEVYEHLLLYKNHYMYVVALNKFKMIEPMHAYFNKDITDVLEKLIIDKSFKMQLISEHVNTKFVQFDSSMDFYNDYIFYNINSRNELVKAKKLLK